MVIKNETKMPPPSLEKLRWFEVSHEVELPESFRRFLTKFNGGVPILPIFFQGARERMVERFLPILEKLSDDKVYGCYDISVVISQLDSRIISDEGETGFQLIPVASLFGGDFICLDFRKSSKRPSVVVWDHELSEDFEPVTEEIADSFEEFLEKMTES